MIKLKSQKGFTLVEMMVTMLIVMILFSAAGSVIILGLKFFKGADVMGNQAQLLVNIENIITEEIRLTNSAIYLGDSDLTEYDDYHKISLSAPDDAFSANYGRVYKDGVEMFAEGFYSGINIFGYFGVNADNTAVTLYLEAVKPNGSKQTRSAIISIPNFVLSKEQASGNTMIVVDASALKLTEIYYYRPKN